MPPPALIVATAAHAAGAQLRVAGLTVIERAVRQLRRIGHEVVVASDGSCPVPPDAESRVIQDERSLEALRLSLGQPPEVAADVVRPANRDLTGGIRVVDEATRKAAEDAVFAELLRGDLGLVARTFNKPISFRITRYLLCRLPVTPNQVTIAAGLVGLVGCALVASGRHALMVAGFFLAHVQSVLDGCDGELARVRFQQSPIGEWLDTLVDDALNFCLTAGLAIGLHRADAPTWQVALAACGAVMLLVYDAVAYRELVRQGEGGEVLKVRWWFNRGAELKNLLADNGRPTAATSFLAMGRRDFFVLSWFVLALVGLIPVVAVYAFVVALFGFVVAVGQLLTK